MTVLPLGLPKAAEQGCVGSRGFGLPRLLPSYLAIASNGLACFCFLTDDVSKFWAKDKAGKPLCPPPSAEEGALPC